jgi:sensor c-di-GMP phosphodiesterase-like protein
VALPGWKKLVAIAIGILLGGLPLIGFNFWLGTLIRRQGLDDISISVARSVDIADVRLDQAERALDILEIRGFTSCAPERMDLLRQVALTATSVKDLLIITADGDILCSSLDVAPGRHLSVPGGNGDPTLDLVQIGTLRFVRIGRRLPSGQWLAALVSADLLLPLTASQGGPFATWVSVTMPDGRTIVEGGAQNPATSATADLLTATARSNRYGLSVTALMPKPSGGVVWLIGSAVNGAAVIGVLLLGWIMTRRRPNHPLADIERALAADEFIPYYQPIVDISSARLLGAEVLVRWRKPDGTIVPPGAFVPLLEQSGLILDMTRKLMRRVRDEISTAYGTRPHLSVSFNITAQHFARETLVEEVQQAFGQGSVRLSQVVLELTERQPLQNMTATRRVIAALQGLGCRVALDDVGTGHSGLSSILKLGVDIIKIDKLFIDSLGNEQNSATIIETLVDLARNMRMNVIAEGVEDFQQVAELRARGISSAQGYLFAPPLPSQSFLALLEAIDLPEQTGGDKLHPLLRAG